jgi:fatty-acyl-CoA synthase
MDGLMMDYPLTLSAILRRAETLFFSRPVVSRLPDKTMHRYDYAACAARVRKLAVALRRLGIGNGDRVATLGWNHHQHLEAYFGIPAAGGILHTLNLRLHPDDLVYIVNHAADKAVLVDAVLLPVLERIRGRIGALKVIVVSERPAQVPGGFLQYEELIDGAREEDFDARDVPEQTAAAMCYTTGTTGRPKAVLYSHRALVIHTYAACMGDAFGLTESDVVAPIVPMFHANAWGLPFAATMVGAGQVFPGPHLDPVSLVELFQAERVTITGGVPTIWMGLLQLLDKDPKAYDLSRLRTLVVGGSAAPLAMIRGFQERHNLSILHAWGMTEMSPLGTLCKVPPDLQSAPADEQYRIRAKQGRPGAFVEIRARGEDGLVPWDGATMGELEVRGPWVAREYYHDDGPAGKFTSDGWFRTGDIVTIDARGFIEVQDRAKDLIKSGGEWISSVALENALMGHPAVAEAAVVSVPHPKWQERPLAAVVLKEGQTATPDDLREFLAPQFASWWLPDAFEFVPAIPRSSAGKFLKSELRERFKDYRFPERAEA